MGYAARVKRKRACRHNCLLKVERTAAELKEHEVVGHPQAEPKPHVVGPVFTAKAEVTGRRGKMKRGRWKRLVQHQVGRNVDGQAKKAGRTIAAEKDRS